MIYDEVKIEISDIDLSSLNKDDVKRIEFVNGISLYVNKGVAIGARESFEDAVESDNKILQKIALKYLDGDYS